MFCVKPFKRFLEKQNLMTRCKTFYTHFLNGPLFTSYKLKTYVTTYLVSYLARFGLTYTLSYFQTVKVVLSNG